MGTRPRVCVAREKRPDDAWERTGLVARPVFKTGEAVARRLVGSIPTRSRQVPAAFTRGSCAVLSIDRVPLPLAVLILAVVLELTAAPALAGPPYQTDDPDPTDYRHFEMYIFTTYENDVAPSRQVGANLPSLEVNYGLMPNVQFSVDIPFAESRPAGGPVALGYDDMTVGVKTSPSTAAVSAAAAPLTV